VLELVFSPVTFFKKRLDKPPNWALALSPLIVCVVAQIVSALMLVDTMQAALTTFTAPASLPAASPGPFRILPLILVPFGYAATYAVATLALVCLDVVTKDSRRGGRLAEFAALAFFAHVPYAIASVVLVHLWSAGEPAASAWASLEDLSRGLDVQRAATLGSPLLSTARLLSYYSSAWYALVITASLQAVTGMKTRGTWLAAAFLLALSVGAGSFTKEGLG